MTYINPTNPVNPTNPYLRAVTDDATAIAPGALYQQVPRPDDPGLPSEQLARQVIGPMLDALAAYLRAEPTLAREMTEGEMTLTLARELFYVVVACKFYNLSGRWPELDELTPWATAPEYLPGRLGMARLLLAPSAASLWPDTTVLSLPFTRASLHTDFTRHLGWHATEEGTRALLTEALARADSGNDGDDTADPFAPIADAQAALPEDGPHLLDDADGRRWAIATEITLDADLADALLGQVVEAVLPAVCQAFAQVLDAGGVVDVSPLNVLLNLGREAVGASFALRAQARGIVLERDDVDDWFWTSDGLTLTTSAARYIARDARFPDVPGFPVTQSDLADAFDAHFGDVPPSRFVPLEAVSFDVQATQFQGDAPRCRFVTEVAEPRVRAGRVRRVSSRGKKGY